MGDTEEYQRLSRLVDGRSYRYWDTPQTNISVVFSGREFIALTKYVIVHAADLYKPSYILHHIDRDYHTYAVQTLYVFTWGINRRVRLTPDQVLKFIEPL